MIKEIQSWQSCSTQETTAVAGQLSERFKPGDIILLEGDLGSGKTFFVQEICRAWNVDDAVTSPTFTLMHHYFGRFPVNHLDLYRIEAVQELDNLGWEEAVFSEAVTFVEWPKLLEKRLEYYYKITFLPDGDCRMITLYKGAPDVVSA